MRSAVIYYNEWPAGILTETDDGEYIFEYHQEYIENHPQQFITFAMPVSDRKYTANRLFPFSKD